MFRRHRPGGIIEWLLRNDDSGSGLTAPEANLAAQSLLAASNGKRCAVYELANYSVRPHNSIYNRQLLRLAVYSR
jgi:hypothetical protein